MTEAVNENEFIDWMAEYLRGSTNMSERSHAYAKDIYLGFLDNENISFGDDNYAWDKGAAITLIDNDISYWDGD